MANIRYIHWNAEEAEARAAVLRQAGHNVDASLPDMPRFLNRLGENPPDALVIDLSRVPSHGRELGTSIRMKKSTRNIPLVFVGGEAEKVERIRSLLPDAVYTDWDHLARVLEDLPELAPGEEQPVFVPGSAFDAYIGRPLIQKLGIKAGMTVGLVRAPDEFPGYLGDLPENARLTRDQWQGCDLVIWFARSTQELESRLPVLAGELNRSPLWIAWPKKGSRLASDLTQPVVRQQGLAHNLVDYKICSIDDTWSALLFKVRK